MHYEVDTQDARGAIDAWLASHGQRLEGFDVQFSLEGASVGVELRGGDLRLFALRFLDGGTPSTEPPRLPGPTLDQLEVDPSFTEPRGPMFSDEVIEAPSDD